MAMQGVSNTLLELIASSDKKASVFLASLKPGDMLKGRVAEILEGQNKAVINFRGYNMMTQLPENMSMYRGEALSFVVTSVNEKVFMKIVNDAVGSIGRGVELQAQALKPGAQQFAQLLTQINVPVNEQNLFIASRLSDYHIPVTRENMAQVTSALNSFLSDKGIDARAFGADSLPAVKETLAMNIFRLMSEASGMRPAASGEAAPQLAKTITPAMQQALSETAAKTTHPAERIANMLSVINSLSRSVSDGSVSGDSSRFSLSFNAREASYFLTAARNASAEGFINPAYIQQVSEVINSKSGTVSMLSGNAWAEVTASKGNVTVVFNNISSAVQAVLKDAQQLPAMRHEVFSLMKNASENRLIEISMPPTPQATQAQTPVTLAVKAMSGLIAQLKSDIISPQNTTPQINAAAIMATAAKIRDTAAESIKALKEYSVKSAASQDKAAGQAMQALAKVESLINKFIANAGIIASKGGNGPGNPIVFSPGVIAEFRAAAREAAAALDVPLFAPKKEAAFMPPVIAAPFDPETSIEALALLKSRQISINNMSFVETMSKYFKSDMKLASNIEALSAAINSFESYPASKAENAQVSGIRAAAEGLKSTIEQMLIRPNVSSGQMDIASQLKAFTDKSGLNLEHRANVAAMSANQNLSDIAAIKDNFKSGLIRLTDEINRIDAYKISQSFRENVLRMREAAADTLSNLSALQMINHKPPALELMYTQLPIFADNKVFNGELQVWYRKNAPKENPSAVVPVNMVFVLNTTNIGTIKVNMSVFKNEVECTVKVSDEKAKQAMNRLKAQFLDSLKESQYNIKAFNVIIDGFEAGGKAQDAAAGGYIELARINLQA